MRHSFHKKRVSFAHVRSPWAGLALLGAAWLFPPEAGAQGAVIFDPGCESVQIAPNDDDYTGPIDLGFDVLFGTQPLDRVYISTNGHIAFAPPPVPWFQFMEWEINGAGIPSIAPFLADADTRPAFQSNAAGEFALPVSYGLTSVSVPNSPFPRDAFCINWVGVGYFDQKIDRLNEFQLLLVERGDTGAGNFDIIYNYDQLSWEAGDGDLGSSGGLGGTLQPRIGYFDGSTAFDPFGRNTISRMIDFGPDGVTPNPEGLIYNSENSVVAGRYVYEIRDGVAPGRVLVVGQAIDPSDFPAPGTVVQVCPNFAACPTLGPGDCGVDTADSTGFYSVGIDPALAAVCTDWEVSVSPTGSFLAPAPRSVSLAGQLVVSEDFVLTAPPEVPSEVTLNPVRSGGLLPVVHWQDPLDLSAEGCLGGSATFSASQNGVEIQGGPLFESSPGFFSGVVDPFFPFHGEISLTISLNCPDGTRGEYSFSLYIDPSGFVVDTRGEPLIGATVTLFRSDGPLGPFSVVPDGSAIMSPKNRANPSLTDEFGHFGWDTVTGYYVVRAEYPGCTSPSDLEVSFVETDILPVPPEWLDLLLVLDCEAITPPTISAPELVTASATSAEGAAVSFSVSAFDTREGAVPVTCSASSGDTFPLGTTEVSCSASDSFGNTATASFSVVVTVEDTGFLPPLSLLDRVKPRRVIPVFFRLTGASAGIDDLDARLLIAPVVGGVVGTEVPAASVLGLPAGTFFPLGGSGLYTFLWSTFGLAEGTYQLRLDLGDDILRTHLLTIAR